jgi:hypothetical protein
MNQYCELFNLIMSELDRDSNYKNLSSLDKSIICMQAIICGINYKNVKLIALR